MGEYLGLSESIFLVFKLLCILGSEGKFVAKTGMEEAALRIKGAKFLVPVASFSHDKLLPQVM